MHLQSPVYHSLPFSCITTLALKRAPQVYQQFTELYKSHNHTIPNAKEKRTEIEFKLKSNRKQNELESNSNSNRIENKTNSNRIPIQIELKTKQTRIEFRIEIKPNRISHRSVSNQVRNPGNENTVDQYAEFLTVSSQQSANRFQYNPFLSGRQVCIT